MTKILPDPVPFARCVEWEQGSAMLFVDRVLSLLGETPWSGGEFAVLPFLPAEFWVALRTAPNPEPAKLLLQWMPKLHRAADDPAGPCATLSEGPADLPAIWLRALADEVAIGDWRTPRILHPRAGEGWPRSTELSIRLPNGAVEDRVGAAVEEVGRHPFFRADLDPWDLRVLSATAIDDKKRSRLPRPPELSRRDERGRELGPLSLRNVMAEIRPAIAAARTLGLPLKTGDLFFFVPPADWDYTKVTKEEWRKGRAFGWTETVPPAPRKSGPIDVHGFLWDWDHKENHWDVQCVPMWREAGRTNIYYRVWPWGEVVSVRT